MPQTAQLKLLRQKLQQLFNQEEDVALAMQNDDPNDVAFQSGLVEGLRLALDQIELPRSETTIIECGHMRNVVWGGDGWHHVLNDGRIGAPCDRSEDVYKVRVQALDTHSAATWQRPHKKEKGD